MSIAPSELTEVTTARVSVKLLRAHPRNPRKHTDKQIARVMKSLERFGQVKPVVAQREGDHFILYAGHCVTEAARRMGKKDMEVKVLPAEWSDEQCAGYMLADNAGGDDDEESLLDLWEEQLAGGFDLESVGTDFETFEALRAEYDVPAVEDKPERPTMVGKEKSKKQIRSVVSLDQIALFEQAIRKTGLRNRGLALEAICQAYLENGIGDFDA